MENIPCQKILYCKTVSELLHILEISCCSNYVKLECSKKFKIHPTMDFINYPRVNLVIPKHFENFCFLLECASNIYSLMPKNLRVIQYIYNPSHAHGQQFKISKYLEHIIVDNQFSNAQTIEKIPKCTKVLKLNSSNCPEHLSKQLLSLKCCYMASKSILPKKLVRLDILIPKEPCLLPKNLKFLNVHHAFYGIYDKNLKMNVPENLKILVIQDINANKIIDSANCKLKLLICVGLCPKIVNLPSNLVNYTMEKFKSSIVTRTYFSQNHPLKNINIQT